MAKLTHWLRNHLPTQRRLIQLYAALLYNAHLKGYISGNIYTGSTKSVCVPGFNCYSCPGAVGACPLGALQNAIASSGSRTPIRAREVSTGGSWYPAVTNTASSSWRRKKSGRMSLSWWKS